MRESLVRPKFQPTHGEWGHEGDMTVEDFPERLRDFSDCLIEYRQFGLGSGVYFLIQKGEVVYVGQSVSVSSRVDQHILTKDFDRVFYIPTKKRHLQHLESDFIKLLRPVLNIGSPLSHAGDLHLNRLRNRRSLSGIEKI